MLARKTSSKNGKTLPSDWTEGLARLLNETYKNQCTKSHRYFDVFGEIYDEELLVVISYISEKDESQTPISCFLSCEGAHIQNEELVKETQNNFIDVAGLFFDEIFSQDQWSEFEANWQEAHYKDQTYFYKLSRENIGLTLEANRLLGADFEN
jgi:hypothetical protein